MTGDTFTERRGFVKKSSGLGGSILFIVALGMVVGAAGVAGLHYGATHGWDQPTSQGPSATEPPATAIATEAPTATSVPTDQVETTSATIPAASAEPVVDEKPAEKPKPHTPPVMAPRPKPKAEPTNEPASTGDPFGTQQ